MAQAGKYRKTSDFLGPNGSGSDPNLLTDQTVTCSLAAAAFSAAAPKLCNTLPDHIRAPCSFPVFKSGLKTHLFRQAFDSCVFY